MLLATLTIQLNTTRADWLEGPAFHACRREPAGRATPHQNIVAPSDSNYVMCPVDVVRLYGPNQQEGNGLSALSDMPGGHVRRPRRPKRPP